MNEKGKILNYWGNIFQRKYIILCDIRMRSFLEDFLGVRRWLGGSSHGTGLGRLDFFLPADVWLNLMNLRLPFRSNILPQRHSNCTAHRITTTFGALNAATMTPSHSDMTPRSRIFQPIHLRWASPCPDPIAPAQPVSPVYHDAVKRIMVSLDLKLFK